MLSVQVRGIYRDVEDAVPYNDDIIIVSLQKTFHQPCRDSIYAVHRIGRKIGQHECCPYKCIVQS